jgi:hypothetical protein
MSFKLNDKQRELLSTAADREDRLLPTLPRLKAGDAKKLAGKLVAAGLAKEVKAKSGAPIWRRDDATEQAYALRLTAAGANAVAAALKVQPETVGSAVNARSLNDRPARRGSRARSDAPTPMENAVEEGRADQNLVGASEPSWRPPRVGSKLDRILGMLSTDKGAALDELTRATGWLPHTARAALTGLRKRGYDVHLVREDRETASTYRVTAPVAEGSR